MAQLVNALFLDQTSVHRAVERLLDLGCRNEDIVVLPSDPVSSRRERACDEVDHADKTATGAGIGGVSAALLAGSLVTGLATNLDPVVAFLAGAGAGGLGGSLFGALVGSILRARGGPGPATEADRGGTIVTVQVADEQSRSVRVVLVTAGGKFVGSS